MLRNTFAFVLLNSQVYRINSLYRTLGLLDHINEKGTFFCYTNTELGIAESLVGRGWQPEGVLLSKTTRNGRHLQPTIVENCTQVQRFVLLDEVLDAHPEDSVVLVLVAQQLHQPLAHQLRAI